MPESPLWRNGPRMKKLFQYFRHTVLFTVEETPGLTASFWLAKAL